MEWNKDIPKPDCQDCIRREAKWEFRYERLLKRQRELEDTVKRLRKTIREMKNDKN